VITLSKEQEKRFNNWHRDCATTHKHFADAVRDVVLPRQLMTFTKEEEVEEYLDDLDRAVRAMR
jgi:hypothetical protein